MGGAGGGILGRGGVSGGRGGMHVVIYILRENGSGTGTDRRWSGGRRMKWGICSRTHIIYIHLVSYNMQCKWISECYLAGSAFFSWDPALGETCFRQIASPSP